MNVISFKNTTRLPENEYGCITSARQISYNGAKTQRFMDPAAKTYRTSENDALHFGSADKREGLLGGAYKCL